MAKTKPEKVSSRYPGCGWAKDPPGEDVNWRQVKSSFSRARSMYQQCCDALVDYFAPIRDQGNRRTSTAFACLSVFEYFEHRIFGAICERSKEFLHAVTLSEIQMDAKRQDRSIRATLEAMSRFGVPPEVYWNYSTDDRVPKPIDRHLFNYTCDFLGLRYARLDVQDADSKVTLKRAKKCLRLEIPVLLGYEVHWLMTATNPFPISSPFYSPGWQSVVACGYDDSRACLLIRNSCGRNWGDEGYGWLPYSYVLDDHAADFWIMWKDEWLDPDAGHGIIGDTRLANKPFG